MFLPCLKLLAWLACVAYSTIPCFWVLIHSRAEFWRSRKRSPYLILLPAWMVTGFLAAALTFPWRERRLYGTSWSWLPAILLFSTGCVLYAEAGKTFSAKQLGGLPEVIAEYREQRLVTGGIRARIRHPVYLAHLCEMLAWSVVTGLVVCYGLTGLAMITGWVMIAMEDRELEARFGAEYTAYKQRVPALWPKLPK
ncbi:MAG TPA: isoprenylcysteine carboxylmethyltransferase family protein [Terriglobales bacterium]|nr:isoprenylcysteine carboxylmethyltransferase family protein [Terriglobales bacterium]